MYTHQGKERLFHAFYSELLGVQQQTSYDFDLASMLPLVADLHGLDEPFSDDEARDALWLMRSGSSPGPDGFGPAFFKTFWLAVKDVVLTFLAAFQAGTTDLDALNCVFLVLLPKKDVVTKATDFWPVSLQTCAPKIASKIMTTRVQRHITDLVAPL
jgi:hypothetical protein